MAIHKINSSDFENDYKLIAIHANVAPYKLAFQINLKLKTKLKKSHFEITFKDNESVFDLYKHESETYNTKLYLISNKASVEAKTNTPSLFENFYESRFLIPELKKAEFLIKIEGGGFKTTYLLKKLNEIESVISCYSAEINSYKSKYNLIFE